MYDEVDKHHKKRLSMEMDEGDAVELSDEDDVAAVMGVDADEEDSDFDSDDELEAGGKLAKSALSHARSFL
jgi:hypothetical protein